MALLNVTRRNCHNIQAMLFNLLTRRLILAGQKLKKKRKYEFKLFCIFHRNTHSIISGQEVKFPDYLWGSQANVVNLVNENMKVYQNFISELEEESLMNEIEPIFKRRRYQFDHWDGAIQGYKETEKELWNEKNSKVIQRLKKIAFPVECEILKHVHVLDLSKSGFIKPHVDSIKFCGSIIAGISLLSSSVMRLVMEQDKSLIVDVLLQKGSLYIMRGLVRYKFTHEILDDSSSFFKGLPVPRERRISIISRNEPT